MNNWPPRTYIHLELVLQPGEVEMQVALFHELRVPTGQLGDNASCHVLHKLVLTVKQVKEWLPDIAVFGVTEYFHPRFIFLKV